MYEIIVPLETCVIIIRNCFKRVYDLLLEEVNEVVEEERNREWVRYWIRRRDTHGASAVLLTELVLEDIKEYVSFLRLTPANFETLLHLFSQKKSPNKTLHCLLN